MKATAGRDEAEDEKQRLDGLRSQDRVDRVNPRQQRTEHDDAYRTRNRPECKRFCDFALGRHHHRTEVRGSARTASSEGPDSGDKNPHSVRASTSSRLLYLLTAVLASLAAIVVMHLWRMHPHVPLYYANGGDEFVVLTWTKALIDDGWYTTISHLGAPYGMSFGDFPVPNLLHIVILRAITLVIPNAGLAVNLYFLAAFPLIALASAYVLRRLKVSWPVSVAVSVVYALLPFRFLRNIAHLYYAQYYLTPILVLAIVWVLRDHPLFDRERRR